jgi:uroporphyrinogen decarboxylase
MPRPTPSFDGLRVAAFESRRAAKIARLIEKYGGKPHVSPSMREVPVEDDPAAMQFARRLIAGEISVVIFLTAVGFRRLLSIVERHVDRRRCLDSLSDVVTIARGPKLVAAMRKVGLTPTHAAPEPNTWREVLMTIDRLAPVANQTVGLQESGKTNPSLIAGLEARGARVLNVRVYNWDLPADTGPLEANVRALADGRLDVLLFTSTHQVASVLRVAEQLGLSGEVRGRLPETVVGSIGPVTSEMLRERGFPVDIEPRHPKMERLVAGAAKRSGELLARKRTVCTVLSGRPAGEAAEGSTPWRDSLFLRACRREPCETTPVWLMRQAGRYMAEYRRIREKVSFLELCRSPALCSEIMVAAVRRLGVDAAIIFSDLLPILAPMGLDLEFAKEEGPVIRNPVRDASDVDRVLELESADSLHFVMETVQQTRKELPSRIPLIGFSGAPFTLASYVIEGGASRNYAHTKTLMYRDEGAWCELMGRLARAVTVYLNAQVASGAQCVQLFDSWVGCLSPNDYRRYVLPFMRQIVAAVSHGAPVIHFAAGNPALVSLAAEGGGAVIGVDWRAPLDEAWRAAGHDKAVQGNLDPAVLLADRAEIRRRAKEILDQAAGRPGHIFNLGHGVLPQTPVDNAIALIDAVHELGGNQRAPL